jgi:hypothetical protein
MNNKPEGSSLYLLNAGAIIQVNGVIMRLHRIYY